MYIQQWERWLQRRFLATGKWIKGPFLVRLSATDFKIYVSWTKKIFWTFFHLQFFGYLNSIGQAFGTHVNNLSPWGLRGMKWSSSFNYQNMLVCVQAVLAWLVGRLERPEKLDRPWNQFERCSETTTRYTQPRLLFVLLINVKSYRAWICPDVSVSRLLQTKSDWLKIWRPPAQPWQPALALVGLSIWPVSRVSR